MRIVFTKNISCTDALKCSLAYSDKLEKFYPDLKRGINYHTTIDHTPNNHKIWFFAYDKDKKHECEHKGEIYTSKSEIIKKYNGKKPTKKEIDNLL